MQKGIELEGANKGFSLRVIQRTTYNIIVSLAVLILFDLCFQRCEIEILSCFN